MTIPLREGQATCGQCAFWGGYMTGDGRGECRRHSPPDVPHSSAVASLWPMTHVGSWCGDFIEQKGEQ